MITRLEARGYKCLADVSVELGPLNVLVGPNASGKSTLLDVLAFISDALRHYGDVDVAVRKRARSVQELIWRQEGDRFSLRVEVRLPLPPGSDAHGGDELTGYQVGIGRGQDGALQVLGEAVGLPRIQGFGSRPDDYEASTRLTLFTVPEVSDRFPLMTRLRDFLRDQLRVVQLDTAAMRTPCRPDAPRDLQADGSNLPLLVGQLRDRHPERFRWWTEHVAGVLEGLREIGVQEQAHDRHLYLTAEYEGGVVVPAWLLSDGTLRFLALSLIAYLPDSETIYIIEEPENGIHPRAIEAVMESLSSVYAGQVFIATHSPLVVGLAQPEQLLCFERTDEGATRVLRGDQHPALANWKKRVSLADLYASGVLG